MFQIRAFSIEEYRSAGCGQFGRPGETVDRIAFGLHAATSGHMCTGCFHSTRGCAALTKLNNTGRLHVKTKQAANESVRQEAARRGLSINEVRRQRQER